MDRSIDNKDIDLYHTFDATVSPDGSPFMFKPNSSGHEPGFFFSVTGIPNEN